MFPVETLKELGKIIADANPSKRIVAAPMEPPGTYYVVDEAGKMVRTQSKPAFVASSAADLETLAKLGGDSCWFNRDAVILLHDSGDDRPRCTLHLAPSPQLALLQAWATNGDKRPVIAQAELILLLRTVFDDCTPGHPQLLANVRKLRTTRAGEVNSEIQKGKVSLNRSDVREMTGMDLIPDVITFKIPVFDAATIKAEASVRVCVDPDPEKEAFRLVVIPGQIEKAFAAGEEWLRMRLVELLESVPIYHGTP